MTRTFLTALGAGASLALAVGLTAAGASAAGGQKTVIELTQTGCQFLEPEGTDHGYATTAKADCEAVNARTGEDRLAASRVMTLKPGTYVFRVTNRDVPYGLGFWIRGDGVIGRATLPSASGGGLSKGVTKDYEITLTPGDYVYSCPLNPTPDYRIRVEG
mgnify:FL=1